VTLTGIGGGTWIIGKRDSCAVMDLEQCLHVLLEFNCILFLSVLIFGVGCIS